MADDRRRFVVGGKKKGLTTSAQRRKAQRARNGEGSMGFLSWTKQGVLYIP